MRFFRSVLWLAFCAWGAAFMEAQNIPLPAATMEMSGYNARGSGLPANSASTLLGFTVEGDATGDNIFHVVTSDPGVIVSLTLPSGVEITSSNASSLGFTYTVLPDDTGTDVQSVLSLPGTHTLIQIPGGQISGLYDQGQRDQRQHRFRDYRVLLPFVERPSSRRDQLLGVQGRGYRGLVGGGF